jgi:HAD superfamily hydrolase (TIGR01509 family)
MRASRFDEKSVSAIAAICFDVGDTLIFDHPSRHERTAAALSGAGLDFDESALCGVLRVLDERALATYLRGGDVDGAAFVMGYVQSLLSQLGLDSEGDRAAKVARRYSEIAFERRLDPGALPLLGQLRRRGFRIGVVSDWDSTLPDLMASLGCGPLVDSYSVSEIVGKTKPDGALFRDALDKLGVKPHECVHVGDYLELDVDGALSAGMRAILFDSNNRYCNSRPGVPMARSFDELAGLLLSIPAPSATGAPPEVS